MLSELRTEHRAVGREPSVPVTEKTASPLVVLQHGGSVLLIEQSGPSIVGNLVLAAQHATIEQLAFLVRHGSGLVCCALDSCTCQRLRIPTMCHTAPPTRGPQYLVSVDAAERISTGISAADRACTLRTIGDRQAVPDDLSRPGHVMVAQAQTDAAVSSWTYAETAVSLTVQAGCAPAAGLCAVVSETDHTRLADREELRWFADRHGIVVVDGERFRANLSCAV